MKKVSKVVIGKNIILINTVTFIFCTILSIGIYQFLGLTFSVAFFICMSGILFFWNKKKEILNQCHAREYLMSLIPALFLGYFSKYLFRADLWSVNEYWTYLNMISTTGSFYFLFLYPIYYYLRYLDKKGESLQYVQLFISLCLMLYLFFIGLPSETFFGNEEEYIVPYTDIVKVQMLPFLLSLFGVHFIFSLFPQKVFHVLRCLIWGLGTAIYIQNMFMNRYIGELTGAVCSWKDHAIYSLVNLLIWILLLDLPYFFLRKFPLKSDRILTGGSLFILLIHATGVFALMLQAPDEVWGYKEFMYDSSEQYVVAAEENVIVFVVDTVDNKYIKQLLEERPEIFEDYKDYTCYMDTCSVYDHTRDSLPQMMTGYEFLDEDDISGEFYQRVKDAGYATHFYNYEADGAFPNINAYIDNFINNGSIEAENEIVLKKDMLKNSIRILTLYQILPCIWKSKAPVDEIDFYHCINIAHFQPFSDYWNEDFDKNLNLSKNEDAERYFIFQHINGTHIPCDDFIDTTAYCLSIIAKMMEQMKELGVYDNATILIVSDHGYHDSDNGAEYPTAATPIFMLKEKNHAAAQMELSNVPVYHEDILPTLLELMGLYQEGADEELFGPSVFSFEEGEKRTRKWYDMELDRSGYRIYEYTGDTAELERVVDENIYTVITMEEIL